MRTDEETDITAARVALQQAIPARVLTLGCHAGESQVEWTYDVDGRFQGPIRVEFPFALDAEDRRLLNSIGVGIAIFLAQLCLARHIELDFSATPEMITLISPLAEMLYDVRCWKDGRSLLPPPTFGYHPGGHDLPSPSPIQEKRACLLWSGGKDSTLSALLLRKNGYQIRPVHITANAGMEASELRAIRQLGPELDLIYQTLQFDFPGFLPLSDAYAVNWNRFPLCNTVPFGRDLALALLASLVARHQEASHLSMGHEHDCKTAYFTYQGKSVPRNDVESTRGALALETYIQRFISPGLQLLPPLAPISEFRVLYEMLVHHSALMAQTSFCFWGTNCGQCSKCFRYALAQRVLGCESVLAFRMNPLEGDNCPELADFLENWRDDATLFQSQILYGLGRLVQKGDIRPGETRLEQFRDEVFPYIVSQLDAMEVALLATYSDPQVPPDFVIDEAFGG